jgi:hypothetical protein
MKRRKSFIVRAVRAIEPARAICLGNGQDGLCSFAVFATRSLPEIELRKMARTHADACPAHVVRVDITDSTFYTATD